MTGATKGIGKSIAFLYAQSGAIVYGIGRNEEALQALASCSTNIRAIQADIRDIDLLTVIAFTQLAARFMRNV